MYLMKAVEGGSRMSGNVRSESEVASPGGLAGWLLQAVRVWKQRGNRERRRKARKQMFLVESLVLGPKQRLVLLRCGREQFLVGTGPEGIQSIVPVGGGLESMPLKVAGEKQWG